MADPTCSAAAPPTRTDRAPMSPGHRDRHESLHSCAGEDRQVRLPCLLMTRQSRWSGTMRVGGIPALAPAVVGAVGAVAAPAAASDDTLLPHPGPEGLVWVPEWTGGRRGRVGRGVGRTAHRAHRGVQGRGQRGGFDGLPAGAGGRLLGGLPCRQGGCGLGDHGHRGRRAGLVHHRRGRLEGHHPLVPDGDPTRIGHAGPRLPAPQAPVAAARRRDRRPPGGPPMYR